MKKLLSKLFHVLILMGLAMSLVVWSFFYEGGLTMVVSSERGGQVILHTDSKERVYVNRGGEEIELYSGKLLETGDVVDSKESGGIQIKFAQGGELRLDRQTRVLLSFQDNLEMKYAFQVRQGRVWLNNLYSNADVNLSLDAAVVFPGQSIVYAKQEDGVASIYVNKNDVVLGLVATDYVPNKVIDESSDEVMNKLYLPQGTASTVFADKVRENMTTISKLLFSKMVKEFNYSLFDVKTLISDQWLSKNVEKDLTLTTKIRNERLEKIRTRGLKYSSLDASNYKLDLSIRDFSNALTFSDERVGRRNLDALYDLLYDAQYLFDNGRKQEAQVRLSSFSDMANQLFMVYGEDLKKGYIERVKAEYEYLSFASPVDSLFSLKQVLEKIYLDSIKGRPEELSMKFVFLTETLSTIGYYADSNESKNMDLVFESYMNSFKDLIEKYPKEVSENITYVQRQNQGLDNLFTQYSALYREKYFVKKLFVENKYLALLPAGKDRFEEIQNVIAQRIDFLRKLENFYLDGKIPLLSDAQNILALLFSEISKIELPADYQVAVKALFTDRLEDFALFSKFLNSPEYVSSSQRGATPRQRYEQFKKDYQQDISIEALAEEMAKKVTGASNLFELGKIIPDEPVVVSEPLINEEQVTTNIDGTVTTTVNQVTTETTTTTTTTTTEPVKVPRVKRPT